MDMKGIDMQAPPIGKLSASVVGLGCNNFGMRINFEQSAAVVDAAVDEGIRLFGTADIYGDTKSEEFLGRALGARRTDIIIGTKFGMAVDTERQGEAGLRATRCRGQANSFQRASHACRQSARRRPLIAH
jgi:aryl-alcohol dehydrogenase-like predicted oxidoreductase